MDGAPVKRVETTTTSARQRLCDSLHRAGLRTYEADMKLSAQLLMDRRIHGSVGITGDWRPGRRVMRVYENPSLEPADAVPKLSILSLDIETDPKAATVLAVALYFHDQSTGTTSGEVLFKGAGAASARVLPF